MTGTRRGRRVFIVKGADRSTQPDMWPGDEVWADDFTLLGYVDTNGEFVTNPLFGASVN